MNNLTDIPNIGKVLAEKLQEVGINNEDDLRNTGSEQAFILLSALENCEPCINMLYALEGAIKGIRWHSLSLERKAELRDFYRIHSLKN
jgi:DNA transformation protein